MICRILQKAQGAVELVDVSDKLPGLKYEKGLTKWKVSVSLNVVRFVLSSLADQMVKQYVELLTVD